MLQDNSAMSKLFVPNFVKEIQYTDILQDMRTMSWKRKRKNFFLRPAALVLKNNAALLNAIERSVGTREWTFFQ